MNRLLQEGAIGIPELFENEMKYFINHFYKYLNEESNQNSKSQEFYFILIFTLELKGILNFNSFLVAKQLFNEMQF